VLFHGPHHHGCSAATVSSGAATTTTISGNNLTLNLDVGGAGGGAVSGLGGAMAISPARSHNSIAAASATTEMKT